MSEDDIARAIERTGASVSAEGEKDRRVELLAAVARGEHGENTESRADRRGTRSPGGGANRPDSQCREGGSNSHGLAANGF